MGKFYARRALLAARANWKSEGKTVVFTNGCYDLLHPGHIRLLEKTRAMPPYPGDFLEIASLNAGRPAGSITQNAGFETTGRVKVRDADYTSR